MDNATRRHIASALYAAADRLDPIVFGWMIEGSVEGLIFSARGPARTISDEEFAAFDHAEKVKRLLYAHRDKVGKVVKVRLDIKESAKQKKLGKQGVMTIHLSPPTSIAPGKVIGYDHSVVLKDVEFVVGGRGQDLVGKRITKKFPFAYTMGKLTNEPAKAGGVPVRYNPHREHLFLDARTLAPLRGADKVVHIGAATYAFGPDYYGPGEAPLPPEGFNSAAVMP